MVLLVERLSEAISKDNKLAKSSAFIEKNTAFTSKEFREKRRMELLFMSVFILLRLVLLVLIN